RVGGGGFFRLAWCGSPACEAALGEGTGATIRVILDGQTPEGPCLVDGAAASHVVLVARAY
ncbi:MAG TPA: proline--tRNA ligase, partial [Actinomycetes bacterium]